MSYQSRLCKVALVLASVATVIVAGYATPLAWKAAIRQRPGKVGVQFALSVETSSIHIFL